MPGNEREKIRHLLVVQDLEGQRTVPLLEATYSLGRDSRNAIVLRSRSVSRQHAILLRVTVPNTDQYGFRIIDGNFKGKRSTNGLFVNGAKCFSHNLQHGDTITFGNHQAQAKYYAISNLSEQAFLQFCEVDDISDFLLAQVNSAHPFENLTVPNTNFEGDSETALTRLASFPELIPNPIIEMDLEGTITYMNPAATLKFPNLRDAGKEHPILTNLLNAIESQQRNSFVREVEVNGEIFEQSVHYLPESDLIRTFIIRDITEQKQAEAELRQRDRLLQAVAEAANYLLAEMNYELAIEKALAALGEAANVDRVCLFQNHCHPNTGELAVSLRFEWTQANVETCLDHWQNQSYQSSGLSRWYTILAQGKSISGLIQDFLPAEQELLSKFKIKSLLLVPLRLEEEFWGYLGLADCTTERTWSRHEESSLLTMAASISGARQRKQVEEKIRHQALHDYLTGLPNRLRFNDLLAIAIANARYNQQNLAVLFLDLDRFKVINDTLGHTLGDNLLISVAQRFKDSLRAGDIVARWGGDEFTILLSEITQVEDATQAAQDILHSLKAAFLLQGHELFISACIGIALLNEDSPDAETLIQNADIALYCAKGKGTSNIEVYKPPTNPPEQLIEKELRGALERGELRVFYQPRVNINSRKITGMEALLRWYHPKLGIVAPSVFIPVAEESGLIVPIGEWVLQQACLQNQAWQASGLPPVTIAVNLSLKQFRQPNLVERVAEILEQTGLESKFLELEITESIAIENIDFTKSVLQNLKQMGIYLSIDDFGTGHSALARLQLLPIDSLKIDGSFIRELTKDTRVHHIIQAIVNLGQNLGLRLVAEGVEKTEELEFLQSVNCDDVQGYLFYRPLSAQQITEVLISEANK
ncbi:MAG TPA: EAL domain-containing protein [Nostocaceae cyanobacterium]|nr:EAL domain-containing protein [Nostocaceae cyanobacterium]